MTYLPAGCGYAHFALAAGCSPKADYSRPMTETTPLPSSAPAPAVVHTLTCKRDLDYALICLDSLRRALPSSTQLVIHDDGSLNSDDFGRLTTALPNSRPSPRKALEEEIESKLTKHPNCLRYRREHALSCKLLDLPLTISEPALFYCDSDIFFIKRPARWLAGGSEPVFSQETVDGYSGSLWKLQYQLRLKLPIALNTGLFYAPLSLYDLDFVEWFLSQPYARVIPWLVEQTGWAALLRGRTISIYDPLQLHCGPPETAPQDGVIAMHFMSPIRKGLPAYAAQFDKNAPLAESPGFRLIPSRRLGLTRILSRIATRCKKRFG